MAQGFNLDGLLLSNLGQGTMLPIGTQITLPLGRKTSGNHRQRK
jgi:hypothetical protein